MDKCAIMIRWQYMILILQISISVTNCQFCRNSSTKWINNCPVTVVQSDEDCILYTFNVNKVIYIASTSTSFSSFDIIKIYASNAFCSGILYDKQYLYWTKNFNSKNYTKLDFYFDYSHLGKRRFHFVENLVNLGHWNFGCWNRFIEVYIRGNFIYSTGKCIKAINPITTTTPPRRHLTTRRTTKRTTIKRPTTIRKPIMTIKESTTTSLIEPNKQLTPASSSSQDSTTTSISTSLETSIIPTLPGENSRRGGNRITAKKCSTVSCIAFQFVFIMLEIILLVIIGAICKWISNKSVSD